MQQPANPFVYPKPITLENLHDLFAHHRGLSGGWSMEGGAGGSGSGSGGEGGGEGGGGGAGGAGTGGEGAGGAGGSGSGSGTGAGVGANATDEQGRDLGYPANTRVAEMTSEQAANYWRYQSQKHEGRYKSITGDRSFDDVKKDLEDLAEIRKSQQTPADQALTERYEAGKADAINEANSKAATAIFRASLQAQGHKDDDINDLVENFNVANFVTDGDVDTTKLATFVKRFTPAGTAAEQRRRDFGAGQRQEGGQEGARGAGGKAEAARRFKKNSGQ